MSETAYSPGLEGVIAGASAISHIDLARNVLTYRGCDVQDLCDNASFEEVAYLLLYGYLPGPQQLVEFTDWLVSEREVPGAVYEVLRRVPPETHPMDWLKLAVVAWAAVDDRPGTGHDANLVRAIRLTAKMPSLVANGWRVVHRQSPTASDPALSHAAHFLHLLTGEKPDETAVRALNVTLILYAEHGFNASTFAARVTVSTLSDLVSGVVSAIGTLKGPLHGGANEAVMEMLLEIETPDRAEAWLRQRLTKTAENPRPRVMGFGHREYKEGDQRARIVHGYLRDLAHQRGDTRWLGIEEILGEVMLREKGLHPNLDYPVAPLYHLMGLPVPLYTPIFVISRITGWCAHIMEQLDNNRLIRPSSLYTGPEERAYVPLTERR